MDGETEREDKHSYLNGWRGGWLDGWMDGGSERERGMQTFTHECMDRWMDGQTNETIHK